MRWNTSFKEFREELFQDLIEDLEGQFIGQIVEDKVYMKILNKVGDERYMVAFQISAIPPAIETDENKDLED